MPRIARIKGEFSTYHIIQRGNERKNLFLCEDDRIRFLDTLQRMKGKYNFKLEAYCLMDNHVHLLINDNGNDISKIVKSINISYAYYFNHVYKRVGHLFQDRFKSEIVDGDAYLLEVSAYIHNNPVKAGIIKAPEEYRWSSFNAYMGREKIRGNLVNIERVLSIFSDSRNEAMDKYYGYVLKYERKLPVIDVEEEIILYAMENENHIDSYEKARDFVKTKLEMDGKNKEELKRDKNLRRELIVSLRQNSSLNLKEIGQLVGGLSQSMICKILKYSI